MKTYTVTLARAETRIITMQVQAADHEAADEMAEKFLREGIDFRDGHAVHAEEWVQDVSPQS
jgi:argininosuccinate lyase